MMFNLNYGLWNQNLIPGAVTVIAAVAVHPVAAKKSESKAALALI